MQLAMTELVLNANKLHTSSLNPNSGMDYPRLVNLTEFPPNFISISQYAFETCRVFKHTTFI